MAAPKGNKNGSSAWFKQLTEEPTVQLGVRVPKSEVDVIDALLEPGQSRSEWLRDAITKKIKAAIN